MNKIHPTAIIGDQVKMGTDNSVGPYVVISGKVEIGNGNWIGPHTSIGGPAEIRGSDLPDSWESGIHQGSVLIGSNNVIREGCIVHSGFFTGTRIGNHCYIMNQTYIAHDCNIGDQVTLSSQVALGGHVTIHDGANLGMSSVVHQRRFIGSGCMVGMGAVITRDVKPFSKSYGNPSRIHGVNIVGLEKFGFSTVEILQVTEYLLRDESTNLSENLNSIFQKFTSFTETQDDA